MHLVPFLVLSSYAMVYALPRGSPSASSVEVGDRGHAVLHSNVDMLFVQELGGRKTQPGVPQPFGAIHTGRDGRDEDDALVFEPVHSLVTRDILLDGLLPRRGANGIVASSLSHTSTNKSPSTPETPTRSPSPLSNQNKPPSTGARAGLAVETHITSIWVSHSVHGVATPSTTEPWSPATTSQRTRTFGSQSPHVSPKVVTIVVCVLVLALALVLIAVVIGVLVWRRKRARGSQSRGVYRCADVTGQSENAWK